MSTTADAVARLTVQAETLDALVLGNQHAEDIHAVLNALAEAERKLADEYVAIREHAPAYLIKRVDKYRTRVHAGADRVEDAIEALEGGDARTALNGMKAAVRILEGSA